MGNSCLIYVYRVASWPLDVETCSIVAAARSAKMAYLYGSCSRKSSDLDDRSIAGAGSLEFQFRFHESTGLRFTKT